MASDKDTTFKALLDERRAQQGGMSVGEFRSIAAGAAEALTVLHSQGVTHGEVSPATVLVSGGRGKLLPPPERPATAPSGCMSPERLLGGALSPADDVYGLAMTLLQACMWRAPEPGYKARLRLLRQQTASELLWALSIDEFFNLFRALHDEPAMRPAASELRFHEPSRGSPQPAPREYVDAGPPPARRKGAAFEPGAQALVVTFATHSPQLLGELYPIDKPSLSIGRGGTDLVVPEATLSSNHAVLRWQAGGWQLDDSNSTNGTYDDHQHERVHQVLWLHGEEVQLGECRLKLVGFSDGSPLHLRARQLLARIDGLTGLLLPDPFARRLDEACLFAEWAELPMHLARYELRATGPAGGKLSIADLLALRRVGRVAASMTDAMLHSLSPSVAGRPRPREVAIAMLGTSPEEARHIAEHVVGEIHRLLPDSLKVSFTLGRHQPGKRAVALLGEAMPARPR